MLSPPSAVGPGNRKTMPGLTTTGEAHLSLPQANSSSSKPSLHHATSEKLSSLQGTNAFPANPTGACGTTLVRVSTGNNMVEIFPSAISTAMLLAFHIFAATA
ncbi:uncharacterized protein LOC117919031 isoform X2 [Vitis riparia]|uniref:uncharacterized protein LOC117917716 isoform X2 n=1 Tax=Vitis riparia TaxID=96939 RepID=UPI00155A64E4|nr:uncharacterized protein LOC117917716 isoform X2 [Vitis riparia]XP_034691947.1 uncharacterized protein LOC117919031 isoform X2 [Vitis riparia]